MIKDQRTRAMLPFDPTTGNVICRRSPDQRVTCNIDQRIVHHSLTGFEWGYFGSGPADLALNILNLFIPANSGHRVIRCYDGYVSAQVWTLHQIFKAEVIATLPKEGCVLTGAGVRCFIESHYPGLIELKEGDTDQPLCWPLLLASFRPQVWVNDYAVDNGSQVVFDATATFLSRDLGAIHAFKENDYDSDYLAEDLPERDNHGGPFEVDVDVDAWLEKNGFLDGREGLSEDDLRTLRIRFGVKA